MSQTQPTNSSDPYAGFPSYTTIAVRAHLMRETDKALQVRLHDGREVWVPKSVGKMGEQYSPKGSTPEEEAMYRDLENRGLLRAPKHAPRSHFKPIVFLPLWFYRKLGASKAA
jgi:hypothetical protein